MMNNNPVEPKLLGITQVAKRWGFSRHHIWNLIDRNDIPAVKSGNKWFIPMAFILEYEAIQEKRSKEKINEILQAQTSSNLLTGSRS